MTRFHDKTVLVTGGARGIGRVISSRLAREGARVLINYFHSPDQATALRDELASDGITVTLLRASVAKPAQLDRMFAEISERFGHLDLLVNNAASGRFRTALDTDEDDLNRALDTNLKGSLWCAQRAHRLMAQRGGAIVNLSSIGSGTVIGNYLSVGTAKAALESLTRYLAVEFAGAQIRVNAASGGLIDGQVATLFPEAETIREMAERHTPLGRLGTADELADVVLFLLSHEARWITGQTVVADGGMSLGGVMLTPPSQWPAGQPAATSALADRADPEPTARASTESLPAPPPTAPEPAAPAPAAATPAVVVEPDPDRHTIAVVGAGLVVPGASSVDQFWLASMTGPELFRATREERFRVAKFRHPDRDAEDKTYQAASGYCDDYEPHPWLAEEIGPDRRQVEFTTQWFRHALCDALRGVGGLAGARISCAIGYTADGNQHLEEAMVVDGLLADLERVALDKGWSGDRREKLLRHARKLLGERYPLTRSPREHLLPYQVGNQAIRGLLPADTEVLMVDTACSSSLYALDLGVKGLLEGRHDVAVCGGSFAVGPRNAVLFAKLHGLSVSGDLRPLDRGCDGVLFSDGAAAVTLKRLDRAKRDGDKVLGYLAALGSSSDGRGKAIYAPNVVGQRLAIERALAQTEGQRPSWVVAHATGTPAGDLCEVTSLRETLGGTATPIQLTSNKSLFGHTGWAAGVVSLIQVLKSFEEGLIPPQHKFVESPAEYQLDAANLAVPTEPVPWPAQPGVPRVASVSGFGFGGTNAHLIVQDLPQRAAAPKDEDIVVTAWSAEAPGLPTDADVAAWLIGSGREPDVSFGARYDTSDMNLRMPPRVIRTLDRCQLMVLRCADRLRAQLGDVWETHKATTATFLGHMGPTGHAVAYGKRTHLDNALDALGGLDDEVALDDEVRAALREVVRAGAPASNEDSFPGIMPNVVSARVANYFDLKGPTMAVDVGFGSTLGALEAAGRYLRSGDVDVVVAGGLNGNSTDVARGLVASLTGRDDLVPAEAVVLMSLMRRSTALRYGQPVLAVVGPLRQVATPGSGEVVACGCPAEDAPGGRVYLGAESGFAALRAILTGRGPTEVRACDSPGSPAVALTLTMPDGSTGGGRVAQESQAADPPEVGVPMLQVQRHRATWVPTVNDRANAEIPLFGPDTLVLTATPDCLGDLGTRGVGPLVISVAPTSGQRRRVLHEISEETVEAVLAEAGDIRHVRIITDLAALAPADQAVDGPMELAYRLHDAAFLALKRYSRRIREASGSVLGLFTSAGTGPALHPYSGFFGGFLKTLFMELRPARVVTVFTDTADFAVATAQLADESAATALLPVARYEGGVRHTQVASVEPAEVGPPRLRRDAVVVAAGGARGITAEVLRTVARRHGCTIYVSGTTPLDQVATELARYGGAAALADKAAFIRRVLADNPGQTPAAAIRLHERLSSGAEAWENLNYLSRFCGAGRAHYRQVDVRDPAALRAWLDDIYAAHPQIDLMIYAAGLNRASNLENKTLQNFRRVRDVKVQGYLNLRQALGDRVPVRWLSFASLIGLTGQLGETDYAAANGFLSSAADYLAAEHGRDERAMGWSLWRDAGMASSAVHHSFFAGAQADTLTQMGTDEGIVHFFREVDAVGPAGATYHIGEVEWAAIERIVPGYWEPRTPPPAGRALASDAAAMPHPTCERGRFYVDRVDRHSPTELVVERTMSRERDGYLEGHLVDGVPTLPGCFVAELMAEAAQALVPDQVVTGFRDIEFHHFLKLGGTTGRTPRRMLARVTSRGVQTAVDVTVLGDVVSPTGVVLIRDRVHYSGTVVLADHYDKAPVLSPWPKADEVPILDPYHVRGAAVELTGEFVTTAETRLHPLGKRARYTGQVTAEHPVYGQFLVPALALDAMARLAVLELIDDRYIPVAAPSRIGRIDLYGPINDADLGALGDVELCATPRGLLLAEERGPSQFFAYRADGQAMVRMRDVAGFVVGFADRYTGAAVDRREVTLDGDIRTRLDPGAVAL